MENNDDFQLNNDLPQREEAAPQGEQAQQAEQPSDGASLNGEECPPEEELQPKQEESHAEEQGSEEEHLQEEEQPAAEDPQQDEELVPSNERPPQVVQRSSVSPEQSAAEAALMPRSKWSIAVDVVLWVLVVVLAVAVVLRAFVFGKIVISGDSMTNPYYNATDAQLTFHEDQVVWVSKTAKPQRGDVVVFYRNSVPNKFGALFAGGKDVQQNGKYEKLIKRVVAMEGDRIWLEPAGNKWRVVVLPKDGTEPIYEDYYVLRQTTLQRDAFLISYKDANDMDGLADNTAENPHVVPAGCFFAMGDNRDNSHDSRSSLGDVPLDRLYGVVVRPN